MLALKTLFNTDWLMRFITQSPLNTTLYISVQSIEQNKSLSVTLQKRRVREDIYSAAENHRLSPDTNRPIESGQRSNTHNHICTAVHHTHRPDALQSFLIRDVMKPLTVSDKVECVRHPAAFVLQTP